MEKQHDADDQRRLCEEIAQYERKISQLKRPQRGRPQPYFTAFQSKIKQTKNHFSQHKSLIVTSNTSTDVGTSKAGDEQSESDRNTFIRKGNKLIRVQNKPEVDRSRKNEETHSNKKGKEGSDDNLINESTSEYTVSKSGYHLVRKGYNPTTAKQSVNGNKKIKLKISKPLKELQRRRKDCLFYNCTGFCKRPGRCPYIHDPSRVAICGKFQHQCCPMSESLPDLLIDKKPNIQFVKQLLPNPRPTQCKRSHRLAADKMPLCSFFAKGSCHKDQCSFVHVKMNPMAPVCREFSFRFYCTKGVPGSNSSGCDKRHVYECPEWVESGECPRLAKNRCNLEHPKRFDKNQQATKHDNEGQRASSKRIAEGVNSKEEVEADGNFIPFGGINDDDDEEEDLDDSSSAEEDKQLF